MVEGVRNFRKRSETTSEGVGLYEFVEDTIEIPDDPEHDWIDKMLRFAEIDEEMARIKAHNAKVPKGKPKLQVPDDLIAERQALQSELDPFLSEQLRKRHRSVLKDSFNVPRRPDRGGKDSEVYFKGTTEEFLAQPRVPRYVTKYSGSGHPDVQPANVEYLNKKYQILRALLGEHIPRSWFVYGEFRHGIPKQGLGRFHTTRRAMTMQREIRGKTFQEMSQAERERPEVQAALDIAITNYLQAREVLRTACKKLGKRPKTFELSLDLGDASPDTREENFNPLTYSSPNAMFDENTGTVMFIDMGWGEWDADKEEVFRYLSEQKAQTKAA
jgi:hypothetical protein